jgi:hypothetical protein
MIDLGYLGFKSPPDSLERTLLYKMWTLLIKNKSSETISALNLKKFLLAIEGVCYDQLYPPSLSSSPSFFSNLKWEGDYYFSPDSGELILSNEDVARIFLKFKPLYAHRIHSQIRERD